MDVDQVRVDLFGFEANTDTPDADGNIWSVETVGGWEAPSQRTQFQAPTALHGSVGAEFFADGRDLNITGEVLSETQAKAWDVYNLIVSAMPGLVGSGDVVVHEPGVPKMLTVVQSRPPQVDPPMNRSTRFRLSVLAEYPWKRALTPAAPVVMVASSTNPFTAAGAWPAEIQLTLTSAGTVHLTMGGLTLATTALPSGAVLTSGPGFTNPEASVLDSGGGDLFTAMIPGYQWPTVTPGSNSGVHTGSADFSLLYYPTYP